MTNAMTRSVVARVVALGTIVLTAHSFLQPIPQLPAQRRQVNGSRYYVREKSTRLSHATLTTSRRRRAIPLYASTVPATKSRRRRLLRTVRNALQIPKRVMYRVMYPKTEPDASFTEPLPPGSYGCPFFGSRFFRGSKDYGPGVFYHQRSKALGHPSVSKFFFMGSPVAAVEGADTIKNALNKEFDDTGGIACVGPNKIMIGEDSLMNEKDRSQHAYLRKLVGNAMSPRNIAKGVEALQRSADEQVDFILSSDSVVMESVCTDFTLDVAWRQILGLSLTEEEIPTFRSAVDDWVKGISSFRNFLNLPGLKRTKGYKARQYLVSLIEDRIEQLEKNGPDGSTLSGMVFVTDDDDDVDGAISKKSRKLSKTQIVDNALLLILAGSETSASTLTVAMLLLGLHPNVWKKIVEEQLDIQFRHGDALTKSQIDNDCPYLDAVIKETMRIRPISGGAPRIAKDTLVIDGYQVPKGWPILFNVRVTHENDAVTRKDDGSHMDIVKGFVPERWLSAATRPVEYVPFGAGPRYCLGANLAMTEMKVFIAQLARRIKSFDLLATKTSTGALLIGGGSDSEAKVEWKKMSIMPQPADGVVISAKSISTS